jgi:hypothetical protein
LINKEKKQIKLFKNQMSLIRKKKKWFKKNF